VPATPNEIILAYRSLVQQLIVANEQLAAVLKDLADHPRAADVAAAIERNGGLALAEQSVAMAHTLARAFHDVMHEGGEG
jgi:hypothetical protein